MKKQYEWRVGAPASIRSADANVIGKRITQLTNDHDGELLPEHVIADAKSKNSPLHALFEWDNTIAAEKYRISQACQVIRSVSVVIEDAEEAMPRQAFVNIAEQGHRAGVYIEGSRVMNDEEYRERLIKKALKELGRFRMRYEAFEELSEVIKAIETVISEIQMEAA